MRMLYEASIVRTCFNISKREGVEYQPHDYKLNRNCKSYDNSTKFEYALYNVHICNFSNVLCSKI